MLNDAETVKEVAPWAVPFTVALTLLFILTRDKPRRPRK